MVQAPVVTRRNLVKALLKSPLKVGFAAVSQRLREEFSGMRGFVALRCRGVDGPVVGGSVLRRVRWATTARTSTWN